MSAFVKRFGLVASGFGAGFIAAKVKVSSQKTTSSQATQKATATKVSNVGVPTPQNFDRNLNTRSFSRSVEYNSIESRCNLCGRYCSGSAFHHADTTDCPSRSVL